VKAAGQAVERADAAPAIQLAPEPRNVSTASPPMPAANLDDRPALDPPTEAPPAPYVDTPEPSRESILAAFSRNRVPPAPPVLQPRPTEPEPERISDEGWEELIAGYVAGTVNWNTRRLGPEPGDPNCRAPRHILRSFGL
jgi:hypothetical protein